MDFVKKNIKWVVLGCLGIAFIGLFLPYATVTAELFGVEIFNQSIIYIEHDGIYVLLALVGCAVLYFLKKEKFSLIPLGIGTAITAYGAINVGKVIGSAATEGVKTAFSIGFYMLIGGLILSVAAICYSEFVLKKQGGVITYNNNIQPNYNSGYQQYGYNQQQPMMQNGYNNDFNVNTSIFNQAPVAQPNMPMENQSQPLDMMQPNMMNQPVMNTMAQQVPVQDFANNVPSTTICPQCGTVLNNSMSFCNQCGSKIN